MNMIPFTNKPLLAGIGDSVAVEIAVSGKVVARTIEGKPRYDIELPNGTVLVGIPASFCSRVVVS